MNLIPQSPRVGRSPKLKAKWLSNTLAYQYGTNGSKKSEIIVLSNDLDQYLQDIFQSIDSKGKGRITALEFNILCDVLNLKNTKLDRHIESDLSFQDFHARLCEHFACYGDYTGFLVNQNFRTLNLSGNEKGNNEKNIALKKKTEFQKRIANAKSHKCIHDAEIFKNWDKLRLSGFRLSEMREHIDQMLYEVAFHKEESQTLKEIIEDLRTMLQASDAQNIGMQVSLKRQQQHLTNETDFVYSNSNMKRLSLPIDGSTVTYKPLKGEEKSLRILARELAQLRELRDTEVKELILFNNQLQNDVTELSREICRLEDENRKLDGQLELIVRTYQCCRDLFAVCVESFKEVESANGGMSACLSDPISPVSVSTPTRTPSLKRRFSFSGVPSKNDMQLNGENKTQEDTISARSEFLAADENSPPEVVLIKRQNHEIEAQQEAIEALQQELTRMDKELSMCRRHLQTSNFQVEALETECSRLLSLEDQLVSVFTLLQKGRSQCLSRKTLGQLLLDVIDSSFGEDEQDMTADQFIRMLQKTLSDCPLFLFSSS